MSNLKIKFTGYKDVGTHVDYLITLSDVVQGESWNFAYRYSFLRSIHDTLKKFSTAPAFPRKKFFGNRNSKFLESRKERLEKYFSKVLSDNDLGKIVQNLKVFDCTPRIKPEEIKPCKESEVGFCKSCTKRACWDIVGNVGFKLIDLSCHPGSMSEDEILDHQEAHEERCKDFKLELKEIKGRETNLELLQEKVEDRELVCRAFLSCTDIFKQSFIKLNS